MCTTISEAGSIRRLSVTRNRIEEGASTASRLVPTSPKLSEMHGDGSVTMENRSIRGQRSLLSAVLKRIYLFHTKKCYPKQRTG